MKRGTKVVGTALLLGLLTALGGCVYPQPRAGVVYSDNGQYYNGNAAVDANDADAYGYDYGDSYYPYAGSYYSPWWGYGPAIGLGFYGSYGYWGGHGYHGPWRGRGGGYHGGGWGGHGGSHGSGGHSSGGHGGGSHH